MTPDRKARLQALAAAHDSWEAKWLPRATYAPPPRLPAGSVLNLHYLDVDPPAGAEDAFQAAVGGAP